MAIESSSRRCGRCLKYKGTVNLTIHHVEDELCGTHSSGKYHFEYHFYRAIPFREQIVKVEVLFSILLSVPMMISARTDVLHFIKRVFGKVMGLVPRRGGTVCGFTSE